MSKVFISYARADVDFARKLAARLASIGAEIWIDIEAIPSGVNWSSSIQQGLEQAELMILALSAASIDSENVGNEWQYFLDEKKPIIPILLEPIKVNHFQLRRLQYVEFHNQPFDLAFSRLQSELVRKGVKVEKSIEPLASSSESSKPRVSDFKSSIEHFFIAKGVDPRQARLNISEEGNFGWSFRRGSAIIEVYITEQSDNSFVQVLSPMMHLPPIEDKVKPLYRRLLELNLQITGAAIGVYLDVVYVFTEIPLSLVSPQHLSSVISSVAALADDLDDKLVAEFGGRLYAIR